MSGVDKFLGQGVSESKGKSANDWFEPDKASTVSWFDKDVDKTFYKPVGTAKTKGKKKNKRKASRR